MMRKVPIGQDYRFAWAPADPTLRTIDATLVVNWPTQAPNIAPTSPTSYGLTYRGVDTVTAISTDRRVLTVTWSGDGAPVAFIGAQPDPAWLDAGAGGQCPVRIVRMLTNADGAGTLQLAEPLPNGITLPDGGAALQWLTLTATIPSGDIPAAPVRPVLWRVECEANRLGASVIDLERGGLAVVWQPFTTGLTDAVLVGMAPWLANNRPAGAMSWAQAIAAGEDLLLSMLFPMLAVGRTEDDLLGSQFLRCHFLATLLVIYDDMAGRGQPRSDARAQAAADLDALLKLALGRLEYLDLNGDGLAEQGESDVAQGAVGMGGSAQDNARLMDYSVDRDLQPVPFRRTQIFGAR